jgi:hypothetical protein
MILDILMIASAVILGMFALDNYQVKLFFILLIFHMHCYIITVVKYLDQSLLALKLILSTYEPMYIF